MGWHLCFRFLYIFSGVFSFSLYIRYDLNVLVWVCKIGNSFIESSCPHRRFLQGTVLRVVLRNFEAAAGLMEMACYDVNGGDVLGLLRGIVCE